MYVKGDFHTHTRHSGDCDMPTEALVRSCMAAGLTWVAVTDHNSIAGALEAREIASLIYPDLRIIVGEEVKSAAGDIIGLFLQEEIPKGLSPLDTVKRIKDQGGLVSIPHPFDRIRRGPLPKWALEDVAPHAHFVETLNARTILASDLTRCRELVEWAALSPLGVSDSHTPGELGSAYTEMEDFDGTPSSLIEAVRAGRVVGRKSNPLVHAITAYVKLKKRFF